VTSAVLPDPHQICKAFSITAQKPSTRRRAWNPKHFWAFVVWNFDTKAVVILEITQTTIQTAMEELIHSEEWGDPLG